MPFIPVPNTAMVEIRMLLDNQRIENTLYFYNPAPWDSASLVQLTNEVGSWWNTSFKPMVPTVVTLSSVSARDLSVVDGESAENGYNVPGTYSDTPMPNNVSLCVSFRTGLAGRSRRGRNYLPCLPRSEVTNNVVAALYRQNVVNAYMDLLEVADENSWQWVVVSRFTNKLPRVTGIFTPVANVVIVDATVDSMRRRLPGRGN